MLINSPKLNFSDKIFVLLIKLFGKYEYIRDLESLQENVDDQNHLRYVEMMEKKESAYLYMGKGVD